MRARQPARAVHRAVRTPRGADRASSRRRSSVRSSRTACWCSGIAFVAGGLRNGTQRFNSPRARMIATLTALAAAILALPTLAHAFHAPAAAHEKALSLICAGVLIVLFFLTLPCFLEAATGSSRGARPLDARDDGGRARVGRSRRGVRERLVRDCAAAGDRDARHERGVRRAGRRRDRRERRRERRRRPARRAEQGGLRRSP